ncbi:hypothetical protein [Methylomagnum ishizawai]|uniref:hypothetical protein n=1 Tax=Methylomagnum ishizawai TaxID=1760988 RepID=UPI001C33E71A|nr:hypothetical protein [Methylomagnum ishizawai]BBL77415.1 hypothetical protein MishRS11D_45130 [Methylomagnum ishizawai]
MNSNNKARFSVLLVTTILGGCTVFDRADRFREFEVEPGKKIGINITDATRRLAVIYPDGRICSELSPPAILEVDKAFIAGGETPKTAKLNLEMDKKTAAVKLTTSTEAIECLRISLFNACSLAATNRLPIEQEVHLYKTTIENCHSMSLVPKEKP